MLANTSLKYINIFAATKRQEEPTTLSGRGIKCLGLAFMMSPSLSCIIDALGIIIWRCILWVSNEMNGIRYDKD